MKSCRKVDRCEITCKIRDIISR